MQDQNYDTCVMLFHSVKPCMFMRTTFQKTNTSIPITITKNVYSSAQTKLSSNVGGKKEKQLKIP